jgi:putative phage-type endonuclease
MKKLVSTLNLPREEWLRYRKQGIGGSDSGAICGFNPYRTAMQVYYDKVSDEIEEIDNEAMRQGREMEEYVAKRFVEETGKKVRRANAMFYDEKNPFMFADVDRMVIGENAGLECKTVSPYMAEHWKDDQIPLSYQMQCYHYMSVCNADRWYVAALIFGREFKVYKLERDDEIIANLIELEKDFWENHVLKRVMPDPDGSKLADSVIAEYFKETTGAVIQLQGFDDKLKRREELVVLLEKMEAEKRQIEQELKIYMGDAEKAENQLFRVSWKSVVSNRLDARALQEQEPEVYQKYLKPTSSRRFTVKAA